MLKRDHILRQFEEFGKVLAALLTFKKNREWERFDKEIQDAVMRFTPFELDYVENLSEEDFWFEILNHPTMSDEQYKILAGLLFEKLDYYLSRNDQEKYLNVKTKCLKIYEAIAGNQSKNEFNLDVHYKLQFLNKI